MTENNFMEIKTAVVQAECMQGKITENCLAAVKLSSQKTGNLENKFETFVTALSNNLDQKEKPKNTQSIGTNTGLLQPKHNSQLKEPYSDYLFDNEKMNN